MRLRVTLREILTQASVRLAYRLLPRYEYNFTPPQLLFLCECLEKTRHLKGPVVEIGCAAGHTTLFLNKYMDAAGIDRRYICVDTFNGFTGSDIEYEVTVRNKKLRDYQSPWKDWSEKLFRRTMALNRISRVRTIQADVNELDFAVFGTPSFCLVDVDLYRPVKSALDKLAGILAPDSLVVVDDCYETNHKYDGARQAYLDFAKQRKVEPHFRLHKLGVFNPAKASASTAARAAF